MGQLHFDNRWRRELPGETAPPPGPHAVQGACWSAVMPTPVAAPRLVLYAPEVAALLGLTIHDMQQPIMRDVLSGCALLPGMSAYATCYGGHQFGQWAGQLGDGRAIYLGEVLSSTGNRYECQLKGAGPTPFSRHADGRAVLRSSLREFLCSEAMHHLGVPTTRALSLVLSGESVIRDAFYDGHPRAEPGAIVCRIAPAFTRFGHFEIFAARKDHTTLQQLIDFTIQRDFPQLAKVPAAQRMREWFKTVCATTARLIVHWMRVGFVHGVMNTDNLSILGLTIDYGPYGWIDHYDPDWTPNTTDAAQRRYRFGQQAAVAYWNLQCLAAALAPVIPEEQSLSEGLAHFTEVYTQENQAMLAAKFGLAQWQAEDVALIERAFDLMQATPADMTGFFRKLADLPLENLLDESLAEAAGESILTLLQTVFYEDLKATALAPVWLSWLKDYAERVVGQALPAAERRVRMNAVNPAVVLRNYLAQQAIEAAEQDDFEPAQALFDALRTPYDETPQNAQYRALRPEWARHRPGCSTLSCSS